MKSKRCVFEKETERGRKKNREGRGKREIMVMGNREYMIIIKDEERIKR